MPLADAPPKKPIKAERYQFALDGEQKHTLYAAAARESVPVAQFIRNSALRAAQAVLAQDSIAA